MLKKWKWQWMGMVLAAGGIVFLLNLHAPASGRTTADKTLPGAFGIPEKAEDQVPSVFTAASLQPKVKAMIPQHPLVNISNKDGGAEKTAEKDGTEKTNLEETNIETTKIASTEKTNTEIANTEKNNTEKTTAMPEVLCTAKDYQVLLNIVQAEAGGCDAIGKILVANVILNRVKSEMFPDTITDVVYEKSQFSPVLNGTINQVEVSDSTEKSVIRALLGEDYSQGALYFMNRRSSSLGGASWFDRKLTYLFQYETHEFFK